jgi:hypothetical protein
MNGRRLRTGEIALNELFLALWLIVKGFDSTIQRPVVAAQPA